MKKSINIYLACLNAFLMPLSAQYNPAEDTISYQEDCRGQYHFSPKSEWMNDINGLVYQGGKYHMIYQWGKAIRHGGYATSKDLIHWKDEGVALIPNKSFLPREAIRNVSGEQVYSGSAVVVSGKTASNITGSNKEAIIAIYTGTGVGTCLAWSNDTGRTWHDYKNNPVANVTNEAYPRDPCVFRHNESSRWIMALYENGTTFYGSGDLINWELLSNINFGFECPDIYQLPLDGDEDNYKWILQDANGTYLVGGFDGRRFLMDEGQDTFIVDLGPDFYAAQTFPKNNLPEGDKRIIQIAWMDHWNGGVGETVWERNATFPVSLGLVTHNGQKRLTRNPIAEISSLYDRAETWSGQILMPGANPLSDIKSKTFELIAEFDLTGTKATQFGFIVANKIISYNVKNNTLLTKSLLPDAFNRIRLRMLVDWAQLEVFADMGIFSYTEQFAFTPARSDIELFTDGEIKLISMEFHELKSIW